nr:Hsp20/alpha crystallin family protein [Paenibacillus popilliae]
MNKASNGTMDWKKFEQFFGGKFPFVDIGSGKLSDNWVENYVQRIVNSVPVVSKNKLIQHEIFQTHHYVFIKMNIPDSIREKELQVSVSSHQLKIEGLPEDQKYVIQLPVVVKARESRASYKDGILQIKVRKNDDDLDFYHVGIRYE